jgi:hypothetical protein
LLREREITLEIGQQELDASIEKVQRRIVAEFPQRTAESS